MGRVPGSAYISRAPRTCRRGRARWFQPSGPSPARSKHDALPPHRTSCMAQVLIIDDHDSMRDGLEVLLRKRGHRTRSAEGGQRGLDLLQEEAADLVITDLRMAKVDGMEVLRRVREHAPETDVLVITAYGTVETAVEAMKRGATDFITKPFSWEEFAVKVER